MMSKQHPPITSVSGWAPISQLVIGARRKAAGDGMLGEEVELALPMTALATWRRMSG